MRDALLSKVTTVTNGVKVTVHRYLSGTTVEATCACFGHPMRVHSNEGCSNRPQRPII